MQFSLLDIAAFFAFFGFVVGFSIFKSRREKDSEAYFLAGRGLTWPLIGLSIVAANISTEQFVGMAGQGAGEVGLAVSSWQLAGAVGIVVIAFTLLPRFLRAGIYTMPEYLEYRYHPSARAIMAIYTMVIYVAVTSTAVLYSGGLTLATIFEGLDLTTAVWLVGGIAALYTTWGGLKAVAWADLFQGAALILGGLFTLGLVLHASGGTEKFLAENADSLLMVLPADHPTLPWIGVLLGMWIPIVYYCGLNQFIVQRTLAAKNLRQGQLGIVFAAGLWVIIPFAIVVPGIAARNLFRDDLAQAADETNHAVISEYKRLAASDRSKDPPVVFRMDDAWKARNPKAANRIDAFNAQAELRAETQGIAPEQRTLTGYKYDAAYPVLIRKLVKPGVRGLMFAAIAGAVISSLASMLNSASTIFTMDLYRRWLSPEASQARLVWIGRAATLLFVVIGCLLAPSIDSPRFKGVFNFIQEFQGYISPGIVAAFLIGFLLKRTPAAAGTIALLVSAPIYGLLHYYFGDRPGTIIPLHFLVRMLITFLAVSGVMVLLTLVAPQKTPRTMPRRPDLDVRSSPLAMVLGAFVILAVIAFFAAFW
ncbi:MAG: sodium/solute symporter [Pirellulales bacterium]|nr:sodium/solute symporter [Pirellulales bacterium]